MILADKHIVITGATSGIGLELVRALYDKNRISIIARPSSRLTQFRQQFPNCMIFEADMGDMKQIELAANGLVQNDNDIDVLINNAAVQYTPTFLDDDFSYKRIETEVNTNFTSICCLCYLMLPLLTHEHESAIVNINSGLGLVPKKNSAVYCGTKGGLSIFSQSLRNQLDHTNISVMQAFLPLVDTEMTHGRGKNKLSPEFVASEIIEGVEQKKLDHDIGKVKILRAINRLFPSLAAQLMKSS
ncbi:MAG: SDR family NAD(P)-dependent oxidoreductase [Pseudomonadales bacterium]|nr:SDR family NAD(P)-dependent oxidoreductase [Pseudomonadales bacterium]MBL6816322.1 SDR family NAD(P)-dependent oxidoreductase [Pseudomonadales bacterium]